jgi:hypothetical protein
LRNFPRDLLKHCFAAALEHTSNIYRLYDYGVYGESEGGVFRGDDTLVCTSIPVSDEITKFIGLLIYKQEEFDRALKDWHSYWDWRRNRNEARWVDQEGGKVDFDCYLDSETEFLTKDGWKKYDTVSSSDLLATVSKDGTLLYEPYNSRFDSVYSGQMFLYENRYTRFCVTPNHNLFVSNCHRSPKNEYSTNYDPNKGDWYLVPLYEMLNARRSFYHVRVAAECSEKPELDVGDDLIRLVGAYLAEGSIAFDRKKVPRAIHIAQVEGGRLCHVMDKIDLPIKVTQHTRKGRTELTYRLVNAELASFFLAECGHGCDNKKLPKFVFDLSYRQVTILLDAMFNGDGHDHSKGHSVYYTTSSVLAEDLQLLLFMNGIASQVYGPYQYEYEEGWLPHYQVFVPRELKSVVCMSKACSHNTDQSGWREMFVEDSRIVCFDVPGSVLVTRNKGKIAVQGNSKNLQHCVRLLMSGQHILEHGEPIVRFEGEQLQYLRDIRANKFSYEQIMSNVERRMELFHKTKDTADIPKKPDIKQVNTIYLKMLDMWEDFIK